MSKSKRSPIPTKLRRLVEIEAGHRCAIPRCANHPIDVHHIIPYEKCKNHSFENLIALCTQCHAKHHRTKEISLKALQVYKSNLGLLNNRYSHFEKRVLEWFIENPNQVDLQLWGRDLDVSYLVKDRLLQKKDIKFANAINFPPSVYFLTEEGKTFVHKWMHNQNLE